MSVYANSANHIVFSGTSMGGNEIWNTGIWIGAEGVDMFPMSQGDLDQAASLFSTFWSTASTHIQLGWQLAQAKAQHVLATGVIDPTETLYHNFAPTIAGGASGQSFPPQCTLVASLRTAQRIGPGSHGRMYIPGFISDIGSNGHAQATDITNFTNNFRTFVNGLNTQFAATSSYVIVNGRQHTTKNLTVVPPQAHRVTSVRVGDVIDTQRRRRDGLHEVYTTQPIP